MTSFEELFNSSLLEVVAPYSSLEFPENYDGERAENWLSRLQAESTDRKVAFFDENIDFLLVLRFPSQSAPSENGLAQDVPDKPPVHLLSFLAHLQISYDASYISPVSASESVIGRPPPRTISMNKSKPATLLTSTHPSIFPPSTPHPIPSAAESDRQYVQVQGTPLSSGVWGEHPVGHPRDTADAFTLLWSNTAQEWIAVYRMSVLVRFMVTKSTDPLLSLTVSTTLRERLLPVTASRKALVSLIEEAGGLPGASVPSSPTKPNGAEGTDSNEDRDLLSGFVEVNLLDGLNSDPTFASDYDQPLKLPSTRLGPTTRHSAFSLPPLSTQSSSSQQFQVKPLPPPGKNPKLPLTPVATFRKSFRKTMKVVSGFHVRMRTVFVPYFLLPSTYRSTRKKQLTNGADTSPRGSISDTDDDEDELRTREQREAGNEEHTVVLSVEIENLFEDVASAGTPNFSFEIQRADVSVSGTGAKTVLVGWGDSGNIFPLRIGPREQVNLLYAVSFLRAPEVDDLSLTGGSGAGAGTQAAGRRASVVATAQEMRRSVSININVRPYQRASHPSLGRASESEDALSYPTNVYASYWSCKLNFSTASSTASGAANADSTEPAVHPVPASPFPTTPAFGQQGANPALLTTPRPSVGPGPGVAGNRKYTFSTLDSPMPDPQARKARSPINYAGPTAMLNPANQPQLQSAGPSTPVIGNASQNVPGSRASFVPPSVAFQSTFMRSPTTYNLPSPDSYFSFSSLAVEAGPGQSTTEGPPNDEPPTPRTPAYPAYPGSPPPVPPTPFWQAPLAQQTGAGAVGPSIEMRRDRGSGLPTPGLNVAGFPLGREVSTEVDAKAGAGGEPIIVSVGLLPIDRKGRGMSSRLGGEIRPLDQFTLDIFVFNQSSWTRRFEVSHPEERRRRRKGHGENVRKGEPGGPGIIPLQNRVRVGPLLPSTCQSVRMDFLALTPGVHPIDELMLTDVQTGYTMHLRSVMDVVVHEPYIEPTETL